MEELRHVEVRRSLERDEELVTQSDAFGHCDSVLQRGPGIGVIAAEVGPPVPEQCVGVSAFGGGRLLGHSKITTGGRSYFGTLGAFTKIVFRDIRINFELIFESVRLFTPPTQIAKVQNHGPWKSF